jgi:parallel beta-helix repeat protein
LPGRVVIAALAATLVVSSLGGLAGSQVAFAVAPSAAPSTAPSAAPSTPPVALDPEEALEARSADRIRAMALVSARETRRLTKAHVPNSGMKALGVVYKKEATIVLLARLAPYTLAELRAAFPAAITVEPSGAWVLHEDILVGPSAHLVIAGPAVKELRLISTPGRFVTIAAWKGRIELRGTSTAALRITSWDPASNGPDVNRTDGRAYIIAKAGKMDVADAQFGYLGFATGESSGVAWRGWPGIPSHGSATRSQFIGNYFGAYTFEAVDMAWTDNIFAGNAGYGFDPHDHSDRFTVTGNMAIHNGSHGMVFSRGCSGNVIRHNMSALNSGNGLVLDDGRVAPDGDPRHLRPDGSNDNVIEANMAWGNVAGIALEGASRNVVRGNLLAGNRVGLRLKDESNANKLAGNVIGGSSIIGIDVYGGSAENAVGGNLILGGKGGVVIRDSAGNQVEHNTIRWIAGRGVVLAGAMRTTSVSGNTISGKGSTAIDTQTAHGLPDSAVNGNDVGGWVGPRRVDEIYSAGNFLRRHPAIAIWLAIFLVPLAWWLPARRRRLQFWRRSAVASQVQ